uniref:Uncharacterized protein n=1 Tax=Leptomonas moramango virus TaxID=1859148 RepID=A0A191Z348_9VIRU|nr:hypothetical protein [Leptomonas moramango virus]
MSPFLLFLVWSAYMILAFSAKDPYCDYNRCLKPNTGLNLVIPSGLYEENTIKKCGPTIELDSSSIKVAPQQAIMVLYARKNTYFCENMENVIRAQFEWFKWTYPPFTALIVDTAWSDFERYPDVHSLTDDSSKLIEAHLELGMLNVANPIKNCRPGPKEWIVRRESDCASLSGFHETSPVVFYPERITENYDFDVDDFAVTIWTKGGSVSSAIRARCKDVYGTDYLVTGNSVRITTNDTLVCLITGTTFIWKPNHETPLYFRMDSKCMDHGRVSLMLDNWHTPSFILSVGPYKRRRILEELCRENRNGGFFRNGYGQQCYVT